MKFQMSHHLQINANNNPIPTAVSTKPNTKLFIPKDNIPVCDPRVIFKERP